MWHFLSVISTIVEIFIAIQELLERGNFKSRKRNKTILDIKQTFLYIFRSLFGLISKEQSFTNYISKIINDVYLKIYMTQDHKQA